MYRGSAKQIVCLNGHCKEMSLDAFTDQNGKIVRQQQQREFTQGSLPAERVNIQGKESYATVSPFLQHQDQVFQNSKGQPIPHLINYNRTQAMKCPCKSSFGCTRCSV
jgi:hypothetical protein